MKKVAVMLGLCLIILLPLIGCSNTAALSGLDSKKETAVAVVHSAAVGLSGVMGNYKTEPDRVNFIRAYADPVRFYTDQTGYFFVYTMDSLNVALPNPKELEGQNLYNHQDSKGNYPIRSLAAAAKNGGGFVEYYWIKPGAPSTEEQRKISYVEPIPGTNYFIGTGVYAGN